MADLSLHEVVEQLTAVLDEAFERPPNSWAYFTEPSPDAGYFGALAKLDAADAARSTGGTSIAGQVSHVVFAMGAARTFIQGDPNPPGLEAWRQSWEVGELNEAAWQRVRDRLRSAYHELRRAIESHAASEARSIGAAIGTVAHVAYHLGAIKQKIAARENPA